MNIPLVDLKAQYDSIRPEVEVAISRVLESAQFILGDEVRQFEEAFASYVGVRECAGVASGTAALQLALLGCGVGPGDEVITASHTFIATSEAIVQVGAKPVFVDIDSQTYTLDPNLVEAAITTRTRAIIPVHIYGQSADMFPLQDIARRHHLWLIEDAAQAHGAQYNSQMCGLWGDLACFSFYPGKNLGAYGDAGAVVGNNVELVRRVKKLRDHGRTSKYEHDDFGYGERMDALQAAILGAKLSHLPAWTEARRAIAQAYYLGLSGMPLILPHVAENRFHVYHLYVIRTPHRDALLDYLKSCGIQAGIHYPVPLHLQPVYVRAGFANSDLPETEKAAREILSLPLYPELRPEQVDFVCETITAFFDEIF
jgi:dTDP-4-amino-4,6-dideoxygalactose transaminase